MVYEGYLTSNANTAWPFDENDGGLDMSVASLFADGYAMTTSDEGVTSVVVRNVSVSKGGFFTFVVRKMCGSSAVAENRFSGLADPDRPYVVATYTGGSYPWSAFVMDSLKILSSNRMDKPGPYALSPSCVFNRASRVMSFTLINGDVASDRISGDVRFVAGNNMYVGTDLSMASYVKSGMDGRTGVIISAIPGAGEGRVPCGESNDEECSGIDGNVHPDAQGDVVIEADGCYQISPDSSNGSIRITGRCTACCQCDDYVDIGNRLADQSVVLNGIYNRVIADSGIYNDYARRFNDSLKVVSADELLVRCVATANCTDAGQSHSVHMDMAENEDGHSICGTIDRAQAVLSIKNTSISDMTCNVVAEMSPQSLVLASIVTPNCAGDKWTNVSTETVNCSGSGTFTKTGLSVPSGSGVTINMYGANPNTQTPNKGCSVTGSVSFMWTEGSGSSATPRMMTKTFSSEQENP